MTEKPKSLYLYDLSWPELKEALPDIKFAIIPVGSTEQHGPNGTFEMDAAGSREFAKKLGERMYPHALVTPPVIFGSSRHHIHFPGTITLRQETLKETLMDIAWSLQQHGIQKLFFVNGHGGNNPVLGVVANRIKHEMGMEVAYGTFPYDAARDVALKHVKSETWGHSCEIEVSCMMYLYPQAVKFDALTPGKVRPEEMARRAAGYSANEGRFFDEVTENGCLGNATLATAEIGKEMVDTALDRLEPYLKEWMSR